jgi:nicotinamide-nucleotide amidase
MPGLVFVQYAALGYNTVMNQDLIKLIAELATVLLESGRKIATAESCTGGLIAKSMTDLAGSSDWFECGFVTYSNAAKTDMTGVPESVIKEYGAVSEAVANAMASGALRHSAADCSIAVTGIAGPAGGSPDKPVGTVWIAVAVEDQMFTQKYLFAGDRDATRQATMLQAIQNLLQLLKTP